MSKHFMDLGFNHLTIGKYCEQGAWHNLVAGGLDNTFQLVLH